MAGSIVVGLLHAPSRPDDATPLGDVLHAPIGVLGLSLAALWSAYLVGMWLSSQRVGTGSMVADYGIRLAPIDVIGVPIGIAAQLGLVWLVYAPLKALWPETFSEDRLEDTARDLVDRADGGVLVLLVALVVIGAPIVEELFFRGMLQRTVVFGAVSRNHQLMGVLVVAAIFAAIHLRPVEFPGLFAFGIVLGVCAWQTGRLGMAVMAHVAFNATGLWSVL